MQKSEFLQKLRQHLDFLSDSDANAVIQFYESKLLEATSPEDEEKLIQSFGDVSVLAKNIKFDFIRPTDENVSVAPPIDESEDFDLIFSKPITSSKGSEIIHSFENKEMKTLYGEKVVVENRKKPVQEIVLEPIDEDNGFTPEEIEHAKEETLEKASKFNTAALNIDENNLSGEIEEEKEKVLIEEEEAEIPAEKFEEKPINKQNGIFARLFSALHLPKSSFLCLSIILSIILSPILITILGLCISAYALVAAVIILFAVLIFILMIGLIVLGVLELVYGFLVLFDHVTIALIELGLGTVLFALVTAISAVSYEFIFGITPRILKKITKFFVSNWKKLMSCIYGGIR